jgi:predicted CXXCH cytochrome family protein
MEHVTMKKIIYSLLLTTLAFSAAEAKVFKAYNGDVEFNHSKHMGLYPCSECHEGAPRPFGINKEKAHKLCIGCHTKEGSGPVRHCSQCHGNVKKEE